MGEGVVVDIEDKIEDGLQVGLDQSRSHQMKPGRSYGVGDNVTVM